MTPRRKPRMKTEVMFAPVTKDTGECAIFNMRGTRDNAAAHRDRTFDIPHDWRIAKIIIKEAPKRRRK